MSPECRSGDHRGISGLLPTARSIWGNQMGISLARIRTTGVRVPRPCWQTVLKQKWSTTHQRQETDNWVTYDLDKGHWLVGGQCAMPFGELPVLLLNSRHWRAVGLGSSSERDCRSGLRSSPVTALQEQMAPAGRSERRGGLSGIGRRKQLAARNEVPLQSLSTSYLNAHLPAVTWVGRHHGVTPYTPTGKRIVGVGVLDGHVVTAVQPYPGAMQLRTGRHFAGRPDHRRTTISVDQGPLAQTSGRPHLIAVSRQLRPTGCPSSHSRSHRLLTSNGRRVTATPREQATL